MQTAVPGTKWADEDPYGPDPQYGLGYTIRPKQFAGYTGVGHGGTNNGWESMIELIPATGDGIVIMANSSNGSAVSSVLCEWRRRGAEPGSPVACPTVDIQIPLSAAYKESGAGKAIALYGRLRKTQPKEYDFSSSELNGMAYQVLRLGDTSGAVELFKLNVEEFPNDWNVYGSLGEAYLKPGDKGDAILNYQKSLQLNPHNDAGRAVLRGLGAS
jgi:tetratricopeptide (TPR) repeat protein